MKTLVNSDSKQLWHAIDQTQLLTCQNISCINMKTIFHEWR